MIPPREIDLSAPDVKLRGFPDDAPSVMLVHGVRGAGKSLAARALAAAGQRPAALIDEVESLHPAEVAEMMAEPRDSSDIYLVTQYAAELARSVMADIDFTLEIARPSLRSRRGHEVIARIRDRRGLPTTLIQHTPEIARVRYTGLKAFWLPPDMTNKNVRLPQAHVDALAAIDGQTATSHIRRAVREYLDRREEGAA